MDNTIDLQSASQVSTGGSSATAGKKVVIVVNEKLEAGRGMNVCAHLALGFGASREADQRADLRLLDYKDAGGESHPNISALSLIVLKANGSQLKAVRQKAHDARIPCIDFVSSMTEGSYVDQLARTGSIQPEDLVYFGVLLFATAEELHPLTRRYSLFR